jgi:NADPH:quinone reductase-like Zn-dependent oxidoreductase
MKAAVVHDFIQPLSIENVAMPEPGDGQVLGGSRPVAFATPTSMPRTAIGRSSLTCR